MLSTFELEQLIRAHLQNALTRCGKEYEAAEIKPGEIAWLTAAVERALHHLGELSIAFDAEESADAILKAGK